MAEESIVRAPSAVPQHDALCTRCGTELEFPDFAIAPESASAAR